MADLKISALTASTTPLSGTEVLPIVQSSTTKQVSVANLTAGRAISALSQDLYLGASNGTYFRGGSGNVARQLTMTTSTVVNPGDTHTIDAISGSGNIILATAGVNRLLVNSSGNAALYTGNLEMRTSGKGIDFSATAGTGTSELLADYEEGTWTPTQGAGLTVVGAFTSDGTYTKVGRIVTIRGNVFGATSVACSSAGVICGGLPFAVFVDTAGSYFNGTLAAGGSVDANSTNINAIGPIAATTGIYFSATYQI